MPDTLDSHADADRPAEKAGLEIHNALVQKLTAAFDLAGTPGLTRYGVALTMAHAIHMLRGCSLSPSAVRLSRRQRAELVRSLKAAQVAIGVVFANRMEPEDQLISIRGCGALILHWAASGRIRAAKPAHIVDADEVAAVFYHQMCAEALIERLSARTAAQAASRAAVMRGLLDVGAGVA